MTKYRILKNENGMYKIQWKGLFFWHNEVTLKLSYADIEKKLVVFKDLRSALAYIGKKQVEETHRKNDSIWRVVWP